MRRSLAVTAGVVTLALVAAACALAWQPDSPLVPRNGGHVSGTVDPRELGLAPARADQLVGGDAVTNAALARAVLAGAAGPHRDVVVLNAAAGLLVGGAVGSMAEGIATAAAVLDDGRAAAALDRLVTASQAAARASA